jgi:hypothetical protein
VLQNALLYLVKRPFVDQTTYVTMLLTIQTWLDVLITSFATVRNLARLASASMEHLHLVTTVTDVPSIAVMLVAINVKIHPTSVKNAVSVTCAFILHNAITKACVNLLESSPVLLQQINVKFYLDASTINALMTMRPMDLLAFLWIPVPFLESVNEASVKWLLWNHAMLWISAIFQALVILSQETALILKKKTILLATTGMIALLVTSAFLEDVFLAPQIIAIM